MMAVQAQLRPLHAGYLADDHGLAHVVQHHGKADPQILKHPVSQTLKAQDVNIHHTVPRVKAYDFLLGLHGELLRHHHQILCVRMFHGLPDCRFVQVSCLS